MVKGGHSRVASLTLSASGEFLSHLGEDESTFDHMRLEELERGLDLKGTEKGSFVLAFPEFYDIHSILLQPLIR